MLKLKQNKGITLIALIITIIVMLILVGVTINVALNGGLFDKAEQAADLTTVEAEKEALSMAAIAAWEVGTGVDFDKMEIPEGFEPAGEGKYKNKETGRIYTIDQKTAKVSEGGTNRTDEDLDYMKSEFEGKFLSEVTRGVDINNIPILKNNEVKVVDYARDESGKRIGAILLYKENLYRIICDDMSLANPQILSVQEENSYIADINNYFAIKVEGTNAVILGPTQNGYNELAINKKLIIPATIKGTNGVTYTVTEIGNDAFEYNDNIEQLEFEAGTNLRKIGKYAFDNCSNIGGDIVLPDKLITIGMRALADCTSINSIYIPSSVDDVGYEAFGRWTEEQTIRMGKTEEPAFNGNEGDSYSEVGWVNGWDVFCDANVLWRQ